MSKMLPFLAIFSLYLLIAARQFPTDTPNRKEFLVTFHPHLDAFWLNSDQELKDINFTPASFLYEMNQRNAKTILNSMLAALRVNPARKYFITEVFFFKDWYEYLDVESRKVVRRLMRDRQFEIANGGWVENDEAVCYFDDIIDQYTLGLVYLREHLHYQNKIGWATDSFGHSHSQVALLHLLGFEFQAIERVDDRYIHQHKNGSLLEFYWSPVSDSNNLSYGGVATYVRHFLHEVNNLRAITPEAVAADLKGVEKVMEKLYDKPKMFRFLGNDFEEFITSEFQMLEKAMKILNSQAKHHQGPVYQYGNPSDYLSKIAQQYKRQTIPVRQEDFMPNWDQDHYWTGYYTTDPHLKKTCKDYSRLLNLFRKIYIKAHPRNHQWPEIINSSNQLLSLMQHHDGITATAKRHIEKQMKQRMQNKTHIITQKLLKPKINEHICQLYRKGNRCILGNFEKGVQLTVLHEGASKTEKIELEMPMNMSYQLQGYQADYFCLSKIAKCFLTFDALLHSGKNIFLLTKVESSRERVDIQQAQGLTYVAQKFRVDLRHNQIDYTFNTNSYLNLSLVKASSQITVTDTVAWNKYGQKQTKQQRRIPGMYIMTNNGRLSPIYGGDLQSLYVGVGKIFTKIYAFSQLHTICLTFKNGKEHLVEFQTEFQPPNFELSDYFIKIESNIDPKEEFYHDMNGYLVKKRKIGFRPDYDWDYKQIDKIAANTYPLCSFAYLLDQSKKLVLFTDRAAGVSLFDKALILNIDRITSDDYKGVGEGYMEIVKNQFHLKIGLVDRNDLIERRWQRQYDEVLVGIFSTRTQQLKVPQIPKKNSHQSYLKYSVFSINPQEFVIRLINLNDLEDLRLSKFNETGWVIPELALNLTYQTITDSFLQGTPITQRTQWINIPNEINIFNYNRSDTNQEIVLRPLQIRSFRIKQQKPQLQNKEVNSYKFGRKTTRIY